MDQPRRDAEQLHQPICSKGLIYPRHHTNNRAAVNSGDTPEQLTPRIVMLPYLSLCWSRRRSFPIRHRERHARSQMSCQPICLSYRHHHFDVPDKIGSAGEQEKHLSRPHVVAIEDKRLSRTSLTSRIFAKYLMVWDFLAPSNADDGENHISYRQNLRLSDFQLERWTR